MGYSMEFLDSRFHIKAEDKDKALQAIRDLYGIDDPTLTLEKYLRDIGWETETAEENEKGDIVTIYFTRDKIGDEEEIFDTIAPFVRPGSFIMMNGEDSYIWRWYFYDKICVEQTGTVVFKEKDILETLLEEYSYHATNEDISELRRLIRQRLGEIGKDDNE